MMEITPRDQCCGCEACANICPKNCISFKMDAEGFFMPEYDVAIGFVKNRMRVDFTTHPVRDRISTALGIPVRHW